MDAVFASLCGAMSGGLISWIISSQSQRSSRRYSLYGSIDVIIDDLECTACGYWRKDGRDISQEVSIKQYLERLDLRLRSLFRELKNDELESDTKGLLDDLYEVTTGESFETSAKIRDQNRIARIKYLCRELRDMLYGKVR